MLCHGMIAWGLASLADGIPRCARACGLQIDDMCFLRDIHVILTFVFDVCLSRAAPTFNCSIDGHWSCDANKSYVSLVYNLKAQPIPQPAMYEAPYPPCDPTDTSRYMNNFFRI